MSACYVPRMDEELSTKHMDKMLGSLCRTVYAGDKNADVLELLKAVNIDSLSEEEKVHLLTRMTPTGMSDVETGNYGLLGFIMRLDRVKCLKTVLQFLPLYSVYNRIVTSQSMNNRDKSAAEVLYENKAVWDVGGTGCETIAKLIQAINSLNEKARVTKRHLETYRDVRDQEELNRSLKGVCEMFERALHTLKVSSVTKVSNPDEAATETIERVSKYVEEAKGIMLSTMSHLTYRRWIDKEKIQRVLPNIAIVFENIKRSKQAVETLRKGKKWKKGGSETESDNIGKQATDLDTLTASKKDAFDLLAAKLFRIGNTRSAIQCTQFLLDQAPDLVHVEIDGRFALDLALAVTLNENSHRIVALLAANGARVSSVDNLVKIYTRKPDTYRYAVNSDGSTHFLHEEPSDDEDDDEGEHEAIRINWFYMTKLIINSNEDQVKRYKDQQGNTLLHILITQLYTQENYSFDSRTIYKCVKELLQAGIPTDRNISGKSALHVLVIAIQSLKYYDLPILFDCAELIVPYFKGMNMKDEDLLENLVALEHARDCPYDKWIGIFENIVENDVIDKDFVVNNGSSPWQMLLRGAVIFTRQSPCKMCTQLSDMIHQTIQKGCNISRSIDAIVRNPIRSNHVHQPSIFRNRLWLGRNFHCNDCCYLTLLKVLLQYGADIMPLIKMDPINACTATMMHSLADPESEYYRWSVHCSSIQAPSTMDMYKICKAFILYHPGCSENLINSLMEPIRAGQETEVNEMTRKLHQLLATPRSLKFLVKCTIMRSMQRKNVDSLPLPAPLKLYLKKDEIETDEAN